MVITAVQAFFAKKVTNGHYPSLRVTIAAPGGGWNSDHRREGQARLAQAERMAVPGRVIISMGSHSMECLPSSRRRRRLPRASRPVRAYHSF